MAELFDAARRARLRGVWAAVGLVGIAAAHVGCADDSPSEAPPVDGTTSREASTGAGGNGNGGAGGGSDVCVSGASKECGHTTHQQGDHRECAIGTQVCVDGQWGTCVIDSFGPPPSPRRHAKLATSPIGCTGDPCDPDCQQFVDTPDDFTPGPGLTVGDGVQLTPGPCVGSGCLVVRCGDGIVSLGEACDDGNTNNGDGCNSACQVEANYTCPTQGQPCVATPCGDRLVQGAEQCDDGNATSGDGCSNVCRIENGWQCPTAGAKCIAKKCGDGFIAGSEGCDDNNGTSGDGCSSTCQIEAGWACTGTPSVCHKTVCGDGKKEGSEQCDDGNLRPYDGCSPLCQIEAKCAGGSCSAVCGDALKFPAEDCDDGNVATGDGCDASCKVEDGFNCVAIDQAPPGQLDIPILYRDFTKNGTKNTSNVTIGNTDFENYCCGTVTGLVKSTLGTDGEPVFLSAKGNNASNFLTDAKTFCWWYHDTAAAASADCGTAGTKNPYIWGTGGAGTAIWLDLLGKPTTLPLVLQANGTYRYSNTNFYPVDSLGWNKASGPPISAPQVATGDDGKSHNFHFTSELHYPFTYSSSAAAATFQFDGDDDVWAFINGKQIIDLGGVHGVASSTYTLTAANATALGLVNGGMYSIDLFQAERHTTGSDYTLTIKGFVHTVSQCSAVCGDGKVKGNEVCDDGSNMGAYGGCKPGCMARGPFCGDGLVTNSEQCDDGVNATTYGGHVATACGPGCKFAPYCGDGIISNGEQCDDGPDNGNGACTTDCTRAYYYTSSFTRDYDGSMCPTGTRVVWIDMGLMASYPAYAGQYGSIKVFAAVGDSPATLSAPLLIANQTGPNNGLAWTNYDLFLPLNAADVSYPNKTTLRLTFELDPSSNNAVSPDLLDWRARYDCAPNE